MTLNLISPKIRGCRAPSANNYSIRPFVNASMASIENKVSFVLKSRA